MLKPKSGSREKYRHAVKVKRSGTGLGLFATEKIPKSTLIIEYFGPVLNNKELSKKNGSKYLFETSYNRTIDGTHRANTARYANHSCKPNCETEVIRGRIYIVSLYTIKPGEELTYDYGEEYTNEHIKPHGCKCSTCLS